jgi:hypothetical protein
LPDAVSADIPPVNEALALERSNGRLPEETKRPEGADRVLVVGIQRQEVLAGDKRPSGSNRIRGAEWAFLNGEADA